ncbi:ATP-NAD kinase family protein [Microbacterium sp. NPDC057659]|uniref:ATP-NAD kinase family protein n=1 Tax=Microbacterium sp. NPDC057659 TaxID=3346198 RepID=UPI0036707518
MIGLVVNPVAGIGGPAGLAGSDGADVQRSARERGSAPRAGLRALTALEVVASRHPGAVLATASGAMGADAVRAAGLVPWVVYPPCSELSDSLHSNAGSGQLRDTTSGTDAADTAAAVAALAAAGCELILVVGGDGTMRDVVDGLASVRTQGDGPADGYVGVSADIRESVLHPSRAEERMPAVLGIPAGVKMYSPVFAVSPRAAGSVASEWLSRGGLPATEREVLDIDEEQMRRVRVSPTLFGTLPVPVVPGRTQARKAATPASEQAAVAAAARGVVARLEPGVRYLLGPGGTTAEVARILGIRSTALGVDVIRDGELLATAASEQQLLDEIAQGPAKAVVTVIGGQGFLLGRGNQQLSARVIRALGDDPLLVVAPEQKLIDLGGSPLIVDTGAPDLDARLAGHIRIVTGASTTAFYPVAAPERLYETV